MLRDFQDQTIIGALDFESVEDWGQVFVELHVDDGTNDLRDLTHVGFRGGLFLWGGLLRTLLGRLLLGRNLLGSWLLSRCRCSRGRET